MNKKNLNIIFLLLLTLSISSCNWILWWITELWCNFAWDESWHCYQTAAIQQGNSEWCEKINQPEEFKKAWSNPPKDKCYLQIAEKTNDPDVCNKIQWWLFSYDKKECFENVAEKNENIDSCKWAWNISWCMQKIISKKQTELDNIKKIMDDPNISQEKLQQAMNNYKKMFEMLWNMTKTMQDMQMTPVRNLRN